MSKFSFNSCRKIPVWKFSLNICVCKRHEALPQSHSQFPHAKVCPKRSSLRIRIFDGVHCKPMFLSSTINSSIIWTKSSTAWAYTNKAAYRMLAIFSPAPISTPWWFKWNFYLRTAASKAALTRTGLMTSPCFTSRSIENEGPWQGVPCWCWYKVQSNEQ